VTFGKSVMFDASKHSSHPGGPLIIHHSLFIISNGILRESPCSPCLRGKINYGDTECPAGHREIQFQTHQDIKELRTIFAIRTE